MSLHTPQHLESIVALVLEEAKKQGATSAEAGCHANTGFSVQVRSSEVESIEYHDDQALSITVYCGQSQGSASTVDTRPEAIQSSVKAAIEIARKTEADRFSGLVDPALLSREYPHLASFYPWNITPAEAIQLGIACEERAHSLDKRITQSEGVSITTQSGAFAYGNSHGFIGSYLNSEHSLSCALIAQEGQGEMQRDSSYTVALDPHDLISVDILAKKAAEKTVARLNPRSLETCRVPVIFASEIARGLIGHFVSAMSGGAIYRKSSFLCGKLNQKIFPEWLNISESPHLLKAMGSSPFDNDGVVTRSNIFIQDGRWVQYALGSYSARQLGLETTGNAGGVHNLIVSVGKENLKTLLKKMDRGLLVTEVMGQGVNIMTGDYSRGASGFWVEKGEIQYPVNQITIASTLSELFLGIVEIASDVDLRGNIRTGSILVNEMTIAGQG